MCSITGDPNIYKCQAFHIVLKDFAKLFYSENIRDKIFKFDEMANVRTRTELTKLLSNFEAIPLGK